MKNIRTTLSLMMISALAAPCAFAQYSDDANAQSNSAGWYLGAEVGRAMAKIDDQAIVDALTRDGSISSSIHNDEHDTAFKVLGGYQFNDYLAIEGGYVDLGKFAYSATTTPAGTLNGNITLKGGDLDVIGFLPFTDRLSGFGRVGVNYTRARDSFSSTGLVDIVNADPSKNQAGYKFGLGLQYRMTHALAMRLEAQRYRVNDAIGNNGDIDLVSVGLVYRFGAKTQMHAAAEPVAPVTAAVGYLPPEAAPAAQPVSYKAVTLFEFDKSDINAQGKGAIDTFASEIKATDFGTIVVSGHTDRIGTQQYNLDLSMRRAETVKNYLIDSAAVPGNKIETKALDGTDPVTTPDQCKGKKVTEALIACLQPDRRVDLEATGTAKPKQ